MSQYSSYSTERDLPRRRHRRDIGMQMLVAVVLALFVSVGTTWATPPEGPSNAELKAACEASNGIWTASSKTCAPAPTPAEACAADSKIWTGSACISEREQCEATDGKKWHANACVDDVPVIVPGEANNEPAACQAPAFLGENDRVCKIVVCNPSGNGETQTVNWSANLQFVLPNAAGICAVAAPIDPVVKVCRDGVTVETKTSLKLTTDVDGECVIIPPSDPLVKVCRDGVTVETKTSLKLTTDVDGECIVIPPSDPVITVCRAGVTTETKTSLKLETDVAGACIITPSDPMVTVCRAGVTTSTKTSLKLTTDVAGECPAGSADTNTGGSSGTGGTAAAGGDTGGTPAVDADDDVAPGDAEAPVDPAAEAGGDDAVDEADAETEDVAAADAAAGDGDSLPFTGFTLTSAWGAGILALLLGAFAHAEASRAARRRRVAAR